MAAVEVKLSRNSQAYAELAQEEPPGPAGTREVLCPASLNKEKIGDSEYSVRCLASYVTVCWVLFILPPNITCPPTGLASPCQSVLAKLHMSLYQLIPLCQLV